MNEKTKQIRKRKLKRFLKRESFQKKSIRDTKELIKLFDYYNSEVPPRLILYLERWIEYKVYYNEWIEKTKFIVGSKIDSSSLNSFILKFGKEIGPIKF